MSVEVELNADDWNCILTWFPKAYGAKNDANIQNKKTYQKCCVMAQAYADMVKFVEEHTKDED